RRERREGLRVYTTWELSSLPHPCDSLFFFFFFFCSFLLRVSLTRPLPCSSRPLFFRLLAVVPRQLTDWIFADMAWTCHAKSMSIHSCAQPLPGWAAECGNSPSPFGHIPAPLLLPPAAPLVEYLWSSRPFGCLLASLCFRRRAYAMRCHVSTSPWLHRNRRLSRRPSANSLAGTCNNRQRAPCHLQAIVIVLAFRWRARIRVCGCGVRHACGYAQRAAVRPSSFASVVQL
ncbi:uncharacterized protein IWZ02DRAFT_507785, partial [Phyllosticta citriasiana]|uniref:uncharacterized protein n=1 Tax=Phyllosticta citriasiana TaxID=595635 RepID=UPI0030FDF08D